MLLFVFNISGIKIASGIKSIVCIVLYLSDINLPSLNTLMAMRLSENHLNNNKWNSSLHCMQSCKTVTYWAQDFNLNPPKQDD